MPKVISFVNYGKVCFIITSCKNNYNYNRYLITKNALEKCMDIAADIGNLNNIVDVFICSSKEFQFNSGTCL